MYKAYIEPDLKTAHLRIYNTFNPFSGFMAPTYILKSAKRVALEDIPAVLKARRDAATLNLPCRGLWSARLSPARPAGQPHAAHRERDVRHLPAAAERGPGDVLVLAAHAQPRRPLQPHVRGVGDRRAVHHLAAHHV